MHNRIPFRPIWKGTPPAYVSRFGMHFRVGGASGLKQVSKKFLGSCCSMLWGTYMSPHHRQCRLIGIRCKLFKSKKYYFSITRTQQVLVIISFHHSWNSKASGIRQRPSSLIESTYAHSKGLQELWEITVKVKCAANRKVLTMYFYLSYKLKHII